MQAETLLPKISLNVFWQQVLDLTLCISQRYMSSINTYMSLFFSNETTSWTGINECLNDVEKTILGTSVALFILATFGMYYAYKVMRNYQIRPFMLRFCVKPADYYLGEVIDAAEEQFQRTSTPTYDDDFDQTLVDSVIAKKKKRRR